MGQIKKGSYRRNMVTRGNKVRDEGGAVIENESHFENDFRFQSNSILDIHAILSSFNSSSGKTT